MPKQPIEEELEYSSAQLRWLRKAKEYNNDVPDFDRFIPEKGRFCSKCIHYLNVIVGNSYCPLYEFGYTIGRKIKVINFTCLFEPIDSKIITKERYK